MIQGSIRRYHTGSILVRASICEVSCGRECAGKSDHCLRLPCVWLPSSRSYCLSPFVRNSVVSCLCMCVCARAVQFQTEHQVTGYGPSLWLRSVICDNLSVVLRVILSQILNQPTLEKHQGAESRCSAWICYVTMQVCLADECCTESTDRDP